MSEVTRKNPRVKLRELLEQYERHLSVGSTIFAFIVDSFTLVRVDMFLTNFLLFAYLIMVGIGITLIHMRDEGTLKKISEEAYRWILIATHFSFGGLFGRFLIYYSRSGSLYASWPLLLIFLGFLIGNEFAHKHQARLVLQVNFFFLAIFSYMIFFVPLLAGQMGARLFILSGLISLSIIYFFIAVLATAVPKRVEDKNQTLFTSTALILIIINILYFRNIIPPIPLALREVEVYHSVAKTSTGYDVIGENKTFYDYFHPYETVHIISGDPVYIYSAVFAPTNFDASVVHVWQVYDPDNNSWVDTARIQFPIVGGQDYGYRGYSLKNNVTPGLWRVNIETVRGQIIGTIKFNIQVVSNEPALTTYHL